MAEAFLYELLQMQNSVHNPSERCTICLEEYGILCRENGTIEVEIRLPCNHTVGSACIATWLKTNNTCPVCRHEFFPAQPRPYLEHGVMDGQEDDEVADEVADESGFRDLNQEYCVELGLDMDICVISELIAQKLMGSPNWSDGHTEWCMVAVSIYMASHLAREPRSPREIAAVVGVEADHIRFTYDLLHRDRGHIADADLLFLLEDSFDEVAPLNWPAPGNEVTDHQIEHDHVLQMLKQGCEEGCNELGLDAAVADISNGVAARFFAAGFRAHLSPRALTAVGIFMASHMVYCSRSAMRVVEAVGMNEVAFHTAYDVAYANRNILIDERSLEIGGRGRVERMLERLPVPRVFI